MQSEDTPTKARYEQSHPNKSIGHPYDKTQDSKDLSHATSITDGGLSVNSYESTGDLSRYFREISGRKFSSQASTYMLPSGMLL